MTNTLKRILTAGAMCLIALGAGLAEYYGIPTIRYLAPLIVAIMIVETIMLKIKDKKVVRIARGVRCLADFGWCQCLFRGHSAMDSFVAIGDYIGSRYRRLVFGRKIGGDKMWPQISPNKTWSGQIAGIACGTAAAVIYGLLGTDTFMPQLMWIGISISLLSQYGDIIASAVKRRLGIDFGKALPGHGGFIDRFDGWILVLPIVWLVMM